MSGMPAWAWVWVMAALGLPLAFAVLLCVETWGDRRESRRWEAEVACCALVADVADEAWGCQLCGRSETDTDPAQGLADHWAAYHRAPVGPEDSSWWTQRSQA